jgi:hypothetical protein
MKRRFQRVARRARVRAPWHATLTALAALAIAPVPTASAEGQGSTRSYVSTRHALTLDGTTIWVASADGGTVTADVIVEPGGPDGVAKKRLGPTRYEDLALQLGLEAKPLVEWVAASWTAAAPPKSGSVLTADFDFRITGERAFTNALVVETTVPALDASSREAAQLTVRLAPELIAIKPGSGEPVPRDVAARPRPWLASNFRLELDGVDGSRVMRIEPFTVGRRPMAAALGATREAARAVGPVQFPNLTVTFAHASAKSWADWHDSFVVKGVNGDAAEKNGAIVFFAPDRSTELGRVTLSNCGIVRLAPVSGADTDRSPRMTAEVYCERMALVGGATTK